MIISIPVNTVSVTPLTRAATLGYLNEVLEASIERLNSVIRYELSATVFVMFRHASVARLSSIISL